MGSKPIEFDYDKTFDMKSGAGVFTRPFFYRGRVYFGAFDKRVYCLDEKTGRHLWHFTANDICGSFPVIANDVLYFTSADGHCYAIDPEDGKLIWKFKTGGRCLSAPTVVNEKVLFGSNDHHMYCIDTDGKLVWKFLTGNVVVSACAVINDSVLFGSYDHNFYSVNRENGKLVWKFITGGHVACLYPTVVDKNLNILWDIDNFLREKKSDEGSIFFGSADHHLYSLDLDGNFKWKFVTGSWPVTNRAHGRRIYFPSYDTHIYSIGHDGSFKWRYSMGAGSESEPLIYENNLYVGSNDTNLYALDLDGFFKWRFKTNGIVTSSPAVHENRLFFGSFDGNMYCIAPDGSLIWKFMTGFGDPVIFTDSSKKALSDLEKAPLMTFFNPEATKQVSEKQKYEADQLSYAVKTDSYFLNEKPGVYRNQPSYGQQFPYKEKKKDAYEQ